jgi:tetratricopeptide (TPR) repeat protein
LLTWAFGTKDWAKKIESQKSFALDADVKERIHTNIGNPEPKTLGYIVSLAGSSLISMKRKDEGIKLYQDALIVSPKDPRINFAYGHIILGTDRKEAIRHWELALSVSPKFPACASALAHERIIDKRYQDAVNLLEPSMESVGWNCDAWLDLADAKIGLRDFPGALAALDGAGKAILVFKPKIDQRRMLIKQLQAAIH